MRTARLRRPVVLQSYTETQDAAGDVTETWATVDRIWAAIEPLQGQEFFSAQQVLGETTARILTRYQLGLDTKMRIVDGTDIWEFQSLMDPESRHEELEIMAIKRG